MPQVESLKSYVELHALYLAAGELIDSQPVYVDKWSGQPRWDHFLRYNIRGLDPLLPIRYARPLPTTAAHYGLFDTTFETWARKDEFSEFECDVWPDAERESLVVSGSLDGYSDDRRFSVNIDSYLVHPETAASLSRLLNSQVDYVVLPHAAAPYDALLQEVVDDLASWQQDSVFEGEISDGTFLLRGWVADWHQELPMQPLSPKQEHHGIWLDVLAPSFTTEQRIRLDPLTLDWVHERNGTIGRSEFWLSREGHGRYERGASGRRLIIRKDFLLDYLRESGLNLVVAVRLRRSRPYESGYKADETFDPGAVHAFVLSADGGFRLDMDQKLIAKGNELLTDFSTDRATTLEKWMAHHLAELMAAESSPDEHDAETDSDRCADLITTIWRIQADKQATDLQHTLWNVDRLPSEDFDYALLNEALKNPPKPDELSPDDWARVFRLVGEAEEWLLRLLNVVARVERTIATEVVEEYLKRESAPDLVTKLVPVFPELGDVDTNDKENVYARVVAAMRRLYDLRNSLLWQPTSSDEPR